MPKMPKNGNKDRSESLFQGKYGNSLNDLYNKGGYNLRLKVDQNFREQEEAGEKEINDLNRIERNYELKNKYISPFINAIKDTINSVIGFFSNLFTFGKYPTSQSVDNSIETSTARSETNRTDKGNSHHYHGKPDHSPSIKKNVNPNIGK